VHVCRAAAVQALVLDRLANGDLLTARTLLQLLLDSKHLQSPAAVPEYAPFAYSLASLLQDLVKSRQLSARSSFWGVAVGEVLLALVDADSQVGWRLLVSFISVVTCCFFVPCTVSLQQLLGCGAGALVAAYVRCVHITMLNIAAGGTSAAL
jgi:hypothetical protein